MQPLRPYSAAVADLTSDLQLGPTAINVINANQSSALWYQPLLSAPALSTADGASDPPSLVCRTVCGGSETGASRGCAFAYFRLWIFILCSSVRHGTWAAQGVSLRLLLMGVSRVMVGERQAWMVVV